MVLSCSFTTKGIKRMGRDGKIVLSAVGIVIFVVIVGMIVRTEVGPARSGGTSKAEQQTVEKRHMPAGAPSGVFWAVPDRVVIVYISLPSFPSRDRIRSDSDIQIRNAIRSIGEKWEIRSVATITGFRSQYGGLASVTDAVIIVVDGPKKK